ncbi:MAG: hypothetical protein OEW48_18705 [Phycisphaerae bacterium]|nr:hypothetical protein [Phycisphaerae bacterium]
MKSKSVTILVIVVISLATFISQAIAEDAKVVVSPQIDIFVGPKYQGWWGNPVAFDSVNERFLVVWTDGGVETSPIDLCGHLVNADGSLYGSTIAISTSEGQELVPQIAFDPHAGRFLVVWQDNRTYSWEVYGQLVNTDGSLYEGNFYISPPDTNTGVIPDVAFDTVNRRFLVVWQDWYDTISAQSVGADSFLYGPIIQITNSGARPKIVFDSNNGRFLVTWGAAGCVYGQIINGDGTPYVSEFMIGYYDADSSYLPSLAFDPIYSRFLQMWDTGHSGQLINTDGTLYGGEISLFPDNNYTNIYSNFVVFDTTCERFLIGAEILHPYNGIAGRLLNPDGSVDGEIFPIWEFSYTGTTAIFAAYGSRQTGSLVVWAGDPYFSVSRNDIFGAFAKCPWCTAHIAGDLNDNCKVDFGDLSILGSQWRQAPGSPSADIAPEVLDNFVDTLDLAVLCEHWLECNLDPPEACWE